MKINQECMCSVLVYLERNITYKDSESDNLEHNPVTLQSIIDALKDTYNVCDIKYSIEKMAEAGYIKISAASGASNRIMNMKINDITIAGHTFLQKH